MKNKPFQAKMPRKIALRPVPAEVQLLKKHLSKRLITWFLANQRPMPWRETSDPYAIWLSEIMLQQTQVATVITYFTRFLSRYPTVESLAAAPPEHVLALWAGLGYYRRAAALHRCAQMICTHFAGKFPQTREALRTLPGIGSYTAGAIASIAFGQSVPVLDGNVMRVLARLLAMSDDIARPTTQKLLWAIAAQLVPRAQAGVYNQALMELGATICLPRQPQCPQCPVRSCCLARRQHRENELPVKTRPRPPQRLDAVAVVLEVAGKKLLLQRPPHGLWAGLWEFPTFHPQRAGLTAVDATELISSALGWRIRSLQSAGTLRHQLTHRTFDYQIFYAQLARPVSALPLPACDRGRYQDAAWVSTTDARPCGTITRKIEKLVRSFVQGQKAVKHEGDEGNRRQDEKTSQP